MCVKNVIREMLQKTSVIRDLNENRLVIRDQDPSLYHPGSMHVPPFLHGMLAHEGGGVAVQRRRRRRKAEYTRSNVI